MKKKFKIAAVWLMINILTLGMLPFYVYAEEETQNGADSLGLTAKACILMEASTGSVIYENNADEQLSPASITKIMTLILVFDALGEGDIELEDQVTTSAYAKSMGGSQVFLEEGEVQSVDTLIKCIIVASGNDACVAMAEYIAGNEEEFVKRMNERAAELGMSNTHFEDCCGLTDSDGHYTSARDVALMSRELITRYPQIFDYSGIWMENIIHTTAKGSSEFGLANTNKLLKQYQWATSKAKYCVSATARKNDIDLIAVVMAAPDYKARFSEAVRLLDYGYANCSLYRDKNKDSLNDVPVAQGVKDSVTIGYRGPFSYLSTSGEDIGQIEKKINLKEEIPAPVHQGDVIGTAEYYLGEKQIGTVDIIAGNDVKKMVYLDCLKRLLHELWI